MPDPNTRRSARARRAAADGAPGPDGVSGADGLSGESLYTALVDALQEGFILLDERGAVVAANARGARILGVTPAEVQASDVPAPQWRGVWEDGSPMAADDFPGTRAARTGETIVGFPMGVLRADGTLAQLTVSAAPIGNLSDGPPYRVVGTLVDVSEQARAQGHNARQRVTLHKAAMSNAKILAWVEMAQEAARTGDLDRTRLILGRAVTRARHIINALAAETGVRSGRARLTTVFPTRTARADRIAAAPEELYLSSAQH